MGMLFGGWAKEEEEKTQAEKDYDRGFSDGVRNGFDDGIKRAQLKVMQSNIPHGMKVELYELLEKSKWKG